MPTQTRTEGEKETKRCHGASQRAVTSSPADRERGGRGRRRRQRGSSVNNSKLASRSVTTTDERLEEDEAFKCFMCCTAGTFRSVFLTSLGAKVWFWCPNWTKNHEILVRREDSGMFWVILTRVQVTVAASHPTCC